MNDPFSLIGAVMLVGATVAAVLIAKRALRHRRDLQRRLSEVHRWRLGSAVVAGSEATSYSYVDTPINSTETFEYSPVFRFMYEGREYLFTDEESCFDSPAEIPFGQPTPIMFDPECPSRHRTKSCSFSTGSRYAYQFLILGVFLVFGLVFS